MKTKKVGLVLSGGGARGFAHLGILKAFEEAKIPVDVMAGASAGALVGTLYSAGLSTDDIYKIVLKYTGLTHLKFSWNKMGLFSLDKLQELLKNYIPHNTFENLNIPIYISVTNLNRGKIEYINSGDLSAVVAASCAIPGFFAPVYIRGSAYIDGGVLNNLPIEPIQDHCHIKIGVNLMHNEQTMKVNSAKDILLKSLLLTVGEKSAMKEPLFDRIIKPKNISKFGGLNVKNAKELYNLGYESVINMLENEPILL